MNLRPYQHECNAAVRQALALYYSCLVEMATGLGKTVCFTDLAVSWPGRVLVLAHREELIFQAQLKVANIIGADHAVEMGQLKANEGYADKSKVIIGSVQTLCKPSRLAKFDPAGFGLVIVDEAHHAVASSYRTVLDHFHQNEACKLLGVTATPLRADKLAMGQVFETVAYSYGIEPAIDDGWLVPVRQQVVKVAGLDFSKVKTVAGDFNQGELSQILSEEEPLHRMTAPLVELAGDRPCLVFCVDVNHARLVDAMLNRYKPDSSAWLSGETPRDTRREVVARYKAGNLQFLCNCALFLEGFDAPATAVVVMARPTKSLALYMQILGRGTRPLPGLVDGLDTPDQRRAAIDASGKPDMLVVDFVGNSGTHKIIQATDVLGGKYGSPVRAYAKQTLEQEGKAAPVGEALERAVAELALERQEDERRRRLVARAQYQTENVSPFDRSHRPALAGSTVPEGERATDRQVWYLSARLGVDEYLARSWTKKQAGHMIGKLKAERGVA